MDNTRKHRLIPAKKFFDRIKCPFVVLLACTDPVVRTRNWQDHEHAFYQTRSIRDFASDRLGRRPGFPAGDLAPQYAVWRWWRCAFHASCRKQRRFGICVMTNAKITKNPDLSRREALKRLGLAVGAAYVTPMLFSLSNAQARSGSSGGSGDNSGSGSGGDDNSGSGSGGDDNSGSGSGGGDDNSGSGSGSSGSGSGSGGDDNSGSGSSGSGSSGSNGTSSASSASTPSSSAGENEFEFSGDPTPAGGNLSPDDELWLINNGWQKAEHR
jgi:hypothetical protein